MTLPLRKESDVVEAMTKPARGLVQIQLPYKDRWLNTYVVQGSQGTAIVDTGPSWDDDRMRILDRIVATSTEPHFLLLTHLDADHRGAAARVLARLPHAVVIAGTADKAGLTDPAITVETRYQGTPPPRDALGAGIPVHITVDDQPIGLDLGDAGGAWQIVGLGGHTAGHIGLFEPRRRILIAGDALQRDGTPDRRGDVVLPPLYVDAALYRRTLDAIADMDPALLLEGHLAPTREAEVARAVSYSREWADRLRAAVSAVGADPGAVARQMHVDCSADALQTAIDAELALSTNLEEGQLQ